MTTPSAESDREIIARTIYEYSYSGEGSSPDLADAVLLALRQRGRLAVDGNAHDAINRQQWTAANNRAEELQAMLNKAWAERDALRAERDDCKVRLVVLDGELRQALRVSGFVDAAANCVLSYAANVFAPDGRWPHVQNAADRGSDIVVSRWIDDVDDLRSGIANLRAALSPGDAGTAVVPDPNRCACCGWPLADSVAQGCVRGNCSQRPRPNGRYDAERFAKEAGKGAT